ncbi:hypothetical protein ON010_g19178 [Phytophthora cinnamomi]|nr:hypothetical protein ON010_g19178 [Phytophthora cinnamomi]
MDVVKRRRRPLLSAAGGDDDEREFLLMVGTAFGALLYKSARRGCSVLGEVFRRWTHCCYGYNGWPPVLAEAGCTRRRRVVDVRQRHVVQSAGFSAGREHELLRVQHEARGRHEEGKRLRVHLCIGDRRLAGVVELQGPQREPQAEGGRRSWCEQGSHGGSNARGVLGACVRGVLARSYVTAGNVRLRVGLPATLAATGTGGRHFLRGAEHVGRPATSDRDLCARGG